MLLCQLFLWFLMLIFPLFLFQTMKIEILIEIFCSSFHSWKLRLSFDIMLMRWIVLHIIVFCSLSFKSKKFNVATKYCWKGAVAKFVGSWMECYTFYKDEVTRNRTRVRWSRLPFHRCCFSIEAINSQFKYVSRTNKKLLRIAI